MENIINHNFTISQKERKSLLEQEPKVIWFTGLSGSGKSTISNELEKLLNKEGFLTYTLDGDNVRNGLNKDLGFTAEDRKENIRRIGEVSKLMIDSGVIVLSTFISPFKEDRDIARNIIGEDNFIEIFIATDIEECKKRDPKGLYKKALNGEIKNFTGIDSPYEKPENPYLIIETNFLKPEAIALNIYQHIFTKIISI